MFLQGSKKPAAMALGFAGEGVEEKGGITWGGDGGMEEDAGVEAPAAAACCSSGDTRRAPPLACLCVSPNLFHVGALEAWAGGHRGRGRGRRGDDEGGGARLGVVWPG